MVLKQRIKVDYSLELDVPNSIIGSGNVKKYIKDKLKAKKVSVSCWILE
jgi:hypothetical protein